MATARDGLSHANGSHPLCLPQTVNLRTTLLSCTSVRRAWTPGSEGTSETPSLRSPGFLYLQPLLVVVDGIKLLVVKSLSDIFTQRHKLHSIPDSISFAVYVETIIAVASWLMRTALLLYYTSALNDCCIRYKCNILGTYPAKAQPSTWPPLGSPTTSWPRL